MSSSEAKIDVGTKLQLGPERPERKRRPRLKQFAYMGRHAYHVVLTVKERAAVFEDVKFGAWCVGQLAEAEKAAGFEVLAYCFMPDHVHFLARGREDASSLIKFVQNFKQRTAYHFKQASGDQLWQQSYFDRVIRADDDLEDVAAYIFQNPVAEGLTADAASYALSGGVYFDGASRTELKLRPYVASHSSRMDHDDD